VRIYFDGESLEIGGRRYYLFDIMGKVGSGYIYGLVDGEVFKIAFYRGGLYYKLDPVSPSDAPTLEISGIKMHRVVGVKPWYDALQKVSLLNISSGDSVLDICTGLGYTAIHAMRMGGEVISVEKDGNVLDIARYNPWSRDLSNIKIFLDDASSFVSSLSSGEFDAIIHDPPRFSRAGELYSIDFYRELYRVLRRGGRLFHYTGKVGYRSRRMDIARGVANRLRRVGFKTKIYRDIMGVYAYK
jgi:hypothetical protein